MTFDLTGFSQLLPVFRQGSQTSEGTTSERQQLKGVAQSRRIPEWLFVDRFGHRQVIHILLPSQTQRHRGTASDFEGQQTHKCAASPQASPFRVSIILMSGVSMTRSRNHQPRKTSSGPTRQMLSAPKINPFRKRVTSLRYRI